MNNRMKDLMDRAGKLGYQLIPGNESTLYRFRKEDGKLQLMQTFRENEIDKLIRTLNEAAAFASQEWMPQFMLLTTTLTSLNLHFSPLQDEMAILTEDDETVKTFPYSYTGIERCAKFIGDEMIKSYSQS